MNNLEERNLPIDGAYEWNASWPCMVTFDDDASYVQDCHFCFNLADGLLMTMQSEVESLWEPIETVGKCVTLWSTNADSKVEAFVTQASPDSDGSVVLYRMKPKSSMFILNRGDGIAYAKGFLVNFDIHMPPSGITLLHDTWIFELASLTAGGERCEEGKRQPTHTILFYKKNNEVFEAIELERAFDVLAYFCTFSCAINIAPAFVEGFDRLGSVIYQEWGARRMDKFRSLSGWLDHSQFFDLPKAFEGFASRMAEDEWKEVIRVAIYWYVRADTNIVGPDGGIILLQAALERLAWHTLVIAGEPTALSKTAYNKLKVAEILRALLMKCNIPLNELGNFSSLKDAMKCERWSDTAEAFTKVRNELTHPKKRAQLEKLPYYETYSIGKWFVELVILRVCSYTGKYSDRRTRIWVGDTVPVPWSQSAI